MAHRERIWVYLYRGSGGELLDHYSMSGRSRSWRYVTAEPGDPIAIRFHVTEEYDWKDANGLLLELFLDSGEAQVALPIPRDPECSTITLNIPDWPCWFEDVSEDGVTSGSWKQTSFEFQEPNKPASQTDPEQGEDGPGVIRIAWRRIRILDYHEGDDQTRHLEPAKEIKTMNRITSAQRDDYDPDEDLTVGFREIGAEVNLQGRLPHHRKFSGGNEGIRRNVRFYLKRKALFHARTASHRIAETVFMKQGAKDIPISTFGAYFDRLTILDPLRLFGDVDEETERIFRNDHARTLDEDRDFARRNGRGSITAALPPREVIELSSENGEESNDDSDAIQIIGSRHLVKAEPERERRVKRERSITPIEESVDQQMLRLKEQYEVNQVKINIETLKMENRGIKEKMARLTAPRPAKKIKSEIVKNEHT